MMKRLLVVLLLGSLVTGGWIAPWGTFSADGPPAAANPFDWFGPALAVAAPSDEEEPDDASQVRVSDGSSSRRPSLPPRPSRPTPATPPDESELDRELDSLDLELPEDEPSEFSKQFDPTTHESARRVVLGAGQPTEAPTAAKAPTPARPKTVDLAPPHARQADESQETAPEDVYVNARAERYARELAGDSSPTHAAVEAPQAAVAEPVPAAPRVANSSSIGDHFTRRPRMEEPQPTPATPRRFETADAQPLTTDEEETSELFELQKPGEAERRGNRDASLVESPREQVPASPDHNRPEIESPAFEAPAFEATSRQPHATEATRPAEFDELRREPADADQRYSLDDGYDVFGTRTVMTRHEAQPTPPIERPGGIAPAAEQVDLRPVPTERGSDQVSVAWTAPKEVNRGEAIPCTLQVSNTGESPAVAVEVHVKLPDGVTLADADSTPDVDGRLVTWQIGRLEPHEVKVFQLGLLSQSQGDLAPMAAVTYTRAATTSIQVLDPQLELSIEGPSQTTLAQTEPFALVVSNPGTGRVRNVVVQARLQGKLQHAEGTELEYTIGTLGPGETRRLDLPLSGREPGTGSIAAVASGDGRLSAEADRVVHVVRPTLEIAIDGPRLRFVDRQATYTIAVQNSNPVPANNVQLFGAVPRGLQLVEADGGGSYDERMELVAWFVGRLQPNESRQVTYTVKVREPGSYQVAAAVRADPGIEEQTYVTTEVEGISAVVLNVTDVDDPIEVAGQTAYRIEVTNEGSKAARNVQVAARVPVEMQAVDTKGPTPGAIDEDRVTFAPIERLEPGQTEVYHVLVHCRQPGQVRFRAYFRSEENPKGVQQEEVTRVYQD